MKAITFNCSFDLVETEILKLKNYSSIFCADVIFKKFFIILRFKLKITRLLFIDLTDFIYRLFMQFNFLIIWYKIRFSRTCKTFKEVNLCNCYQKSYLNGEWGTFNNSNCSLQGKRTLILKEKSKCWVSLHLHVHIFNIKLIVFFNKLYVSLYQHSTAAFNFLFELFSFSLPE